MPRLNPETPLRPGDRGVMLCEVVATDPASVVCPESIFVNAITTLGIPLVSYAEYRPDEGQQLPYRRQLVWKLREESIDGLYTFKQLREWWEDPAWLEAHPAHELAIIHAASQNLLRFAERARKQPVLYVTEQRVENGRIRADIPADATPEQRARLLEFFQ